MKNAVLLGWSLAALAVGAAQAGTFFASVQLSLDVPLNGGNYMIGTGVGASTFTNGNAEGVAAVTALTASTGSFSTDPVLLGLFPATLDVTAGPVAGIAQQWGHADAASGISSAGFTITNQLPNQGQDITLTYTYSFLAIAQKFSDEEDEYSNARVDINFLDNNAGFLEQIPFEVRLEPEDGAGILQSSCNNCTGTLKVHLDGGQTVDLSVGLLTQGNATWIPEPSTASLAVTALLALAAASLWTKRAPH